MIARKRDYSTGIRRNSISNRRGCILLARRPAPAAWFGAVSILKRRGARRRPAMVRCLLVGVG